MEAAVKAHQPDWIHMVVKKAEAEQMDPDELTELLNKFPAAREY